MEWGALTGMKSAIVCWVLGAAGGGCNQIPTLAATAVAASGSAYFKKLLFTAVENETHPVLVSTILDINPRPSINRPRSPRQGCISACIVLPERVASVAD